ncbi:hypothetical protein BDK92_5824 [Micromonospora pisi]|uniref:Uncharacterized protein n=1 Tax=Micromonospora pisi TaxID=589240 RepID=A0A495JSD1_9ACTN|nr:hypothetical protein [Micromonospora pisi]RKR91428.1 hypothetical protein BDK92_5824 [Micromonospora pisi]
MSHSGKNKTPKESARSGRHAGSGARGRQGETVERSEKQRHQRAATGTSSSERDYGRSKVGPEGRTHTQGTG